MFCCDEHMQKDKNLEIQTVPYILSFFGLDVPQAVTAITDGIGNHSYFVRTVQGDYVVKFLVTQKPIGIENDIAIQHQLAAAGVKTPMYIQNRQGQYVYGDNGLNAVVSKKIDGVIPRFASTGLSFEIGKILAVFHTRVTKLPNPCKGWMNPDVLGIRSEEVKLLFAKPLSKGITHGDMHTGNVLIEPHSPDRVHAIFDFEEAGEDLFVVDLARSVLGVCHSKDGHSLLPELVNAEIEGYESVRRLNEEEKILFPHAVKYAADACIKWFIEHGYEKYVESHRKRASSFRMPVQAKEAIRT